MEYEDLIKGVEVSYCFKEAWKGECISFSLSRVLNKELKNLPLEYLKNIKEIKLSLPEDLDSWYNTKK